MLKSVWSISCLLVLLFPMLTLASGTKIICEGDRMPKCFKRKAGAAPVARSICPTKKGWVIIIDKKCLEEVSNSENENNVPAAAESNDNAIKIEGKGKYK